MNTVLIIIVSLVTFFLIIFGIALVQLNPEKHKDTKNSSDSGIGSSDHNDDNNDMSFGFD